jgi:hypothetical protein
MQMLVDAFSSEPKTIELFGNIIYVVPGWWTVVAVPVAMIFLFWLFFRNSADAGEPPRLPKGFEPDA